MKPAPRPPYSRHCTVVWFYGITGVLCLGKCVVAAADIWMEWKERP